MPKQSTGPSVGSFRSVTSGESNPEVKGADTCQLSLSTSKPEAGCGLAGEEEVEEEAQPRRAPSQRNLAPWPVRPQGVFSAA